MKKLLILFAATALVTGLCLRDSSRLRADENDPNDPDNVELVTPPTSPDAEKFYDGNVIISYDLDDDESGQVAGETNEGKTDRLPGSNRTKSSRSRYNLARTELGTPSKPRRSTGGRFSTSRMVSSPMSRAHCGSIFR